MLKTICCLSLGFVASTVHAGSIEGAIHVGDEGDATGMVVYLEGVPGTFKAPNEPVRLSQRGQKFRPTLLPVLVGTRVDMSNDDYTAHNIFSKSEPKTFDLERQEASFPGVPADMKNKGPSAAPDPVLLFDRPGEVDLRCNIHPNMYGVVLVLQNPFFTRPDRDGKFRLEKVPAGTYTLHWVQVQTGAPSTDKTVRVKVPGKGKAHVKL